MRVFTCDSSALSQLLLRPTDDQKQIFFKIDPCCWRTEARRLFIGIRINRFHFYPQQDR